MLMLGQVQLGLPITTSWTYLNVTADH